MILGAVVALASTAFAASGNAQALPADPCDAISDASVWNTLGSGLQRKILVQCDAIDTEAAEAAGAGAEAGLAAEGAVKADGVSALGAGAYGHNMGADIQVNAPDYLEPITRQYSTQSETSIVAVGKKSVCAAWNDSGSFALPNGSFSGFGYSRDGGKTWADGGPFPIGVNGPLVDRHYGDPSLAYSVRDDTVYFAALSDAGLSLWKSTDRCRTFQYVGVIHSGLGDDKQLMAVDNNKYSPYYGRIYVGWTDFARAADRNVTTYSNDGGATWSAPAVLPGSGRNGQGMWPAIAHNGHVYFALVNRSFVIGGLQDQWIYKSVDGGATWVQKTNIATGQLRPENAAASGNCFRQALNGNIRHLSSPQIAISKDSYTPAGYVIHAVYAYDSDGAGPDNSNVFYRRSVNGALSWSPERRLNDDATNTDQFFPALTVPHTKFDDHYFRGAVAVSWYDRRLDPVNNLGFDRFAVISPDNGMTWGANKRISDVTSPVVAPLAPVNFDPVVRFCYHGDYDQMDFNQGKVHILWSDDRRAIAGGFNPDVYYQNIEPNTLLGW